MKKDLNEELIIKKRRKNFTMIDNNVINDNRISWKAKGILIYLLSKPNNWKVIIKDIVNHGIDGESSVYNALKELRELGYYSKVPVRNKKGKIIYWQSYIYENPEDNTIETLENSELHPLRGFPQMDNPQMDNPQMDNPQMDNPQMDNPQIDYPQIDYPQIENRDRSNTKNNNTKNYQDIIKTTTTEPTTDTEHTNDGYSEQEKNVVVVSTSTTAHSTDIGIENDDIKKTPDKIPDVEVSEIHNISDTIIKTMYDNFSITLSKTQIEKLTCACNNDLELFNSKVELLKQQSEVNNIFGWILTAIEKDYQPNTYTNIQSKNNNKPKNRIVNYKGHNWNYEELEELEQKYLENSLKDGSSKEIKSKINKALQETFDETFDNDQLIKVLYRCKYDFDIFKVQLEQLKDKVKQNPEDSLYKLYLSIPQKNSLELL